MPVVSTLQIHQAYFGAVNGTSHGQLASSMTDTNLRSFLSAFTDRPGVPTAGFELQPYLAATSYEDYYLICRTWPDNEVSRLGMVFTHVLILPLLDLPVISELKPILNLLLDEPLQISKRPTLLFPIPLLIANGQETEPVSVVLESWLAVINQMIEQPESLPVFAMGEVNRFQELIETLWRGVPGALRARLSWGIRFIPPSSKDHVPILVNVPDELEAKWRGKTVIKLTTTPAKMLGTPIEQLILNGKQRNDFLNFIESIEVRPKSFKELKLCQRAYEQFKHIQAVNAETGKLLAFLRTLRQLQPEFNKAVSMKQQAVQSLAKALLVDGEKEAMGLRNLPLAPFRSEAHRLEQAVEQVVRSIIMTVNPDETMQKSLLSCLADIDPDSIEAWWRKVAVSAFEQTLSSHSIQVARFVWLGIAHAESIRNYILEMVPNTTDWEHILSKTVPESLPISVADTVISFSASRNWWDLCATSVGVAYKPTEALRKQVKAEKKLNISQSSRVSKLAKQVPDSELVELALELPTTQLLELAGEVCGRSPGLLASINMRQQPWRTIWSVSLIHTKSVTAGLSEPKETISVFLTEVANGRANDTQPLELIAASPFANVLHLPERFALWDKLPAKFLSKFVSSTLDALVEEILANTWTGDIEPVLVTKARSVEFTGKFLGEKRSDPAAVLNVNAILQNLTDNYLKDYINNLSTINGIIAAHLGKLINIQHWTLSANALLNKAKYNTDFRPALYECAGMFNRLTKFMNHKLFGHQVTSHDAWNALEELMISLYEEGPEKDNIWKRAGGDITKLSNAFSRREQWSAAIRLLRQGGGGKKVSVESLINVALEDFKYNPNLQALVELLYLFK